jgi:CHAT domain-containing protein
LPALPAAVAELASIRAIYAASSWFDGSEGSRNALSQLLGRADVVHFAGHAITDDFYPSRSRLLLSGGDTASLGPADIAATKLAPGATVVLGACETSIGRVYRGEGASSLARSFLAAGATSVVGSLWKVQDASAMTLLTGFHRALADGVPVVQALAQAQRSMMRQGFPVRDWAAFQVIGGLQRSHS